MVYGKILGMDHDKYLDMRTENDGFSSSDHPILDGFIIYNNSQGADESFVATNDDFSLHDINLNIFRIDDIVINEDIIYKFLNDMKLMGDGYQIYFIAIGFMIGEVYYDKGVIG